MWIPWVTLLGALLSVAAGGAAPGHLRFDKQGNFKIVQFTDLHYGEDAELDLKSDRVGLLQMLMLGDQGRQGMQVSCLD